MKKAAAIVKGMMEWTDLDKALERAGMGPAEALAALQGREGRRQVEALRALARIHAEVIAFRFRPMAASRLCAMLQEEQVGVRLKAALAVLEMTCEATERRSDGATKGEEQEIEEEGDAELMQAVAEVLGAKRRAALMGAGPGPNREDAKTRSEES